MKSQFKLKCQRNMQFIVKIDVSVSNTVDYGTNFWKHQITSHLMSPQIIWYSTNSTKIALSICLCISIFTTSNNKWYFTGALLLSLNLNKPGSFYWPAGVLNLYTLVKASPLNMFRCFLPWFMHLNLTEIETTWLLFRWRAWTTLIVCKR